MSRPPRAYSDEDLDAFITVELDDYEPADYAEATAKTLFGEDNPAREREALIAEARKTLSVAPNAAPVEVMDIIRRLADALSTSRADDADEPSDEPACTDPHGHVWVYTGGGDDERWSCYCIHCGADGDA